VVEILLRQEGIKDMKFFKNRLDAGEALAKKMLLYKDKPEILVLAFRKAGLPVAYEVANRLDSQMEIFLLANVKANDKKPISIGTVASGGIEVLNDGVIESLNISKNQLAVNILVEKRKLMKRQHGLRGDRPYPKLTNRLIILVDDGIAKPAKARAAIKALKKVNSKQIIYAVPVITRKVKYEIESEVDQLVTVAVSESISQVRGYYENVSQVLDYRAKMFLR
jgi:putative phosphoribosyl transferase